MDWPQTQLTWESVPNTNLTRSQKSGSEKPRALLCWNPIPMGFEINIFCPAAINNKNFCFYSCCFEKFRPCCCYCYLLRLGLIRFHLSWWRVRGKKARLLMDTTSSSLISTLVIDLVVVWSDSNLFAFCRENAIMKLWGFVSTFTFR